MQRDCDVCGKTDDLARHIHEFGDGQPATMRHLHCCAQIGCPSDTCTTTTKGK